MSTANTTANSPAHPDFPFAATIEAISSQLAAAGKEHLLTPRMGIVCGSGLSTLGSHLREKFEIPYASIPGFGHSSVPGHKSSLAFGLLGSGAGVPVVVMLGRFHPYEGHKLTTVTYPVRVMAKLGAKHVIITNAAGGLNPKLAVGTIVVVHDHLALPDLTGFNPLLGPPTSPDYLRFLPVSDAYSPTLRRSVFLAAHKLGLPWEDLAEGTYAWVSGPTYETPAEGRFLRAAGADVVGMSTVPEVLAAREEGMDVCVLSLVTNAVVIPETYWSIRDEVEAELAGKPIKAPPVEVASHEEVLEVGRLKAEVMRQLVEEVVTML